MYLGFLAAVSSHAAVQRGALSTTEFSFVVQVGITYDVHFLLIARYIVIEAVWSKVSKLFSLSRRRLRIALPFSIGKASI